MSVQENYLFINGGAKDLTIVDIGKEDVVAAGQPQAHIVLTGSSGTCYGAHIGKGGIYWIEC